MNPTIERIWHTFSEPLEGRVLYMYLDAAEPTGLVTVGVGNLIDPLSLALQLPFRRASDGQPASASEITAAWLRVKGLEANKLKALPLRSDPSLVLAEEFVDDLVLRKLRSNHVLLRRRWKELDAWPLDAQLAIHSWAWAVGPHSPYPRMSAALHDFDFAGAAGECTINPQRGTIVERNRRNRVLFHNAAHVVAAGLPRDELVWPEELPIPAPDTAPERHPADEQDEIETPRIDVPSRRPPTVQDFAIVHPPVPLGRSALDTVIGMIRPPPADDDEDDGPPEAA